MRDFAHFLGIFLGTVGGFAVFAMVLGGFFSLKPECQGPVAPISSVVINNETFVRGEANGK